MNIFLFRVLRDKLGGGFNSFISKKVVAVAGDAAVENMGIKNNIILNVMFEEILSIPLQLPILMKGE